MPTHYKFTEDDLDTAAQDAISSCVIDPESCGISIQTTPDSSETQTHSYQLSEGWNMIGGKDASDTASIRNFIEEHNANTIFHWDGHWLSYIKGTPEFLNSLTNMKANKGYFVHIPPQQ